MDRRRARFADKLPGPIGWYFRLGTKSSTKDTRAAQFFRYGPVFHCGLGIFLAGVLSVAGVRNLYE